MGEGDEETGRQRVRERLLGRCDEAGLVRRRGETVEQHDRMRARLVDELDHMTVEGLDTLAELVIDNAGGRGGREWPPEVTVRHLARSLEPRPVELRRIVRSWLASVEGPPARAGGYLVELFRWLQEHGRPPGGYDMRQIRAEAEANRRVARRIAAAASRGVATDDDRAWSEAYARDRAAAEAIVEAGEARRAGAKEAGHAA